MVFLDRKGEKANQKGHQWPQEINCSWCRIAAFYSQRKRRKTQNFQNVLSPSMWVEKNSSSKFLLKYPHLLCTFHKEICLLKGIAVICFIIVCGKKDCSEGTSCFCWISGHQETNKFGFFGRLESAISTELVVLQTQNNFSSLL